MSDKKHPVRIIHYNDVYNIDEAPREPLGGAARFVTAIKQSIQSHSGESLVLFSGDAFSPAPLTNITEGAEIPPILNATCIDVACIGNHELDNGLDIMKQRISETNFPWLVSNVFHRGSSDTLEIPTSLIPSHTPLANLRAIHTISRGGFKFGFMGLASLEWLATLDKVGPAELAYVDFCEAAEYYAIILKQQHSCDFIIALTHMREPDDELLASKVTSVDLFLGGHDHIKCKKLVGGKWVLKSGSDFKNFSTIDLIPGEDGTLAVQEPMHYDVTSEFVEDPDIKQFVEEQLNKLGSRNLPPLAITETELDARFVSIRTRETGLGNFVADVMAEHMDTNIALINAGSFRSDMVEPAGKITANTIDAILPFKDQVVRVSLTDAELLAMLEASVSDYPLLAGKFCQVSGVRFSFDPLKKTEKIDRDTVLCKDDDGSMKPIEENRVYEVALKSYIFEGKDGFPAGDPKNILGKAVIHVRDFITQYFDKRKQDLIDSGEDNIVPIISPTVENRIICLNPNKELYKRYLL